jgi:hypothetical protein
MVACSHPNLGTRRYLEGGEREREIMHDGQGLHF